MSPFQYEREHYRIQYPTAAPPRFTAGELQREVIDLCEQGLRYRAAEGETPAVNDEMTGVVRLRRGTEVPVAGIVVRIVGREIALRLTVGVPLPIVLDEQRYLRERFRGSAS